MQYLRVFSFSLILLTHDLFRSFSLFTLPFLSFCSIDKDYLKHQITVEVDLKKFNVPAEFGLKTSTELKDSKFDHSANLYLHSSKDKSEYTYHVYVHPKESGKRDSFFLSSLFVK